MSTIPVPGSETRHVRKTITFTGGAGAGAVGTVTVFTITGRVRLVNYPSVYCTEAIVDAGGGTATLEIGVTGNPGLIDFDQALNPADALGINQFWRVDGAPSAVTGGVRQSQDYTNDLAANVILTIANEAINNGTLVIDLWYYPITDDGALAGDDIDDLASVNLLKLNWSGITGEAGRSMLNALRAIRNKVSTSGATLTVTKEDDTTSAWTATVTTDAAANPITGIDPA